jgi:hypothetical protein
MNKTKFAIYMSALCFVASVMFFFIKTPYIYNAQTKEMKLNKEEDYYTVEGKSNFDYNENTNTYGADSPRGSFDGEL